MKMFAILILLAMLVCALSTFSSSAAASDTGACAPPALSACAPAAATCAACSAPAASARGHRVLKVVDKVLGFSRRHERRTARRGG